MSKWKGKPTRSGRSERQPQVVVFEPDRPIRALLAEWLEMEGYGFIDGQAVGAQPNFVAQCDVVLIDVRAPLRSARQAVAGMAAAVPHASIIAMSADALASGKFAMEAVARELGVAAVLVKPFDRDALMQALERARAEG
jgi:DNA-binding NtrC family response regulator